MRILLFPLITIGLVAGLATILLPGERFRYQSWTDGDAGVTMGRGSRLTEAAGNLTPTPAIAALDDRTGDTPSSDTLWRQGLAVGVNGPIPLIVVDQFGYPTKASKFAVIRNPQAGYDSSVHFTPGKNYAVVDKSTGKIVKVGRSDSPGIAVPRIVYLATKSGGLISPI